MLTRRPVLYPGLKSLGDRKAVGREGAMVEGLKIEAKDRHIRILGSRSKFYTTSGIRDGPRLQGY